MNTLSNLPKLSLAMIGSLSIAGLAMAEAPKTMITVNDANFSRAVTDRFMGNWDRRGADKHIVHLPGLAPAGPKAPVVRMNQDAIYSSAIVRADAEGYVRVGIKEHVDKEGLNDIYTSVHIVDENSSSPAYKVGPGDHKIKIETDWAFIIFRAGVEDKSDLKDALHAQQRFYVDMSNNGAGWEAGGFDPESLDKVEKRLKREFLEAGEDFIYYASADGKDVNLGRQARSNAMGWGGMPIEVGVSNIYRNTKQFDGSQCQQTTFDVPNNKYFTSITLYDSAGYMLETARFSINSYEWDVNDDGTVTISFGCDESAPNNLITEGNDYNYTLRNYGVSVEVQYDRFGGRELKYLAGGKLNPDYK